MISEGVFKDARIVIVDDEPVVVDVLERFFRKAGYENIASATNSDEALRLCDRIAPDLIVLDLQMPGRDGFWLLERLHERLHEDVFTPIIVLTGDAGMERRRRALAGGAHDILVKPVDYIELMLRIRQFLDLRFRFLRLEAQNRSLQERVLEVGAGA